MHLDEGTIHSWLDGELSAEDAERLEMHARDCAACSERVAEARGLMAAASRALSALDDVPAVVLASSPRVVPRAPRRRWWSTPRFAAAAAMLLVAAGSWRVLQVGQVPPKARSATEKDAQSPLPAVFERSAPAAFPDSTAVATAPAREAREPERLVASPPSAQAMATHQAPSSPSAQDAANRPVPAAPAAPPAAENEMRAAVMTDTAALPKRTETVARATAKVAADSAAPARRELARSGEGIRLGEVVTTSAAVSARAPADSASVGDARRARRDAAQAPDSRNSATLTTGPVIALGAPGARCFTLTRSDVAKQAGVPESIQILEMPGPTIDGRALRVVMSTAGAGWFWQTAPDASIILIRVTSDRIVYETRVTGLLANEVRGTLVPCAVR